MSDDPVIQRHRAQIAELDLRILEALNQRIRLVKQLKDYKETQGLSFYDGAQEERVLSDLRQANRGPLSDEGLTETFKLLLTWSKHDAAALGSIKPD